MPDNKKLYAIKVADLIVNNETKNHRMVYFRSFWV